MPAAFAERGWRPAPESDGVLPGLRWVGGTVDAESLVFAVSQGHFPLPTSTGELGWYSPDPRGVLELSALRRHRSAVKAGRQWHVTFDRSFAAVVEGCADRDEVWITDEYRTMYATLHAAGRAHSVEVWRGDELVGGLFGIALGRFWAGESMFNRVPNAAKTALFGLVDELSAAGCLLLDVQYVTPFLASLGATEIPRGAFEARLAAAVTGPPMQLGERGSGAPPHCQ